MADNLLMAPDNLLIPTPDLVRAYRAGKLIGAYVDSDALPAHLRKEARWHADAFKRESPHPLFETAPKQDWKAGAWKGKRALLWHCWSKADPQKALWGAQVTGDCVSWGERCKQDIRRCVEFLLYGEREVYLRRQATCLLYSGRGHTGQGASPSGVANWALKCGILLEDPAFRDSSGKVWDFSDYQTYVRHGISYGRTGMPQAVIDVTGKNRVLGQSKVTDIEQLCDLFINGYATSCGFSLGTSSSGNPVSRIQGSVAHQTCMVGFDDTPEARAKCKESLGYEDTLIFWDQSWGAWNNVTNRLPEWEPWGQGMYIHSARDTQRFLNEREAITTTGSIQGFVGTNIDNLLI